MWFPCGRFRPRRHKLSTEADAMGKRAKDVRPPPRGAIFVEFVSVFDERNVGSLIACVSKSPQESPTWVVEKLNAATADYYTAFAFSKMATASEQAAWARKLAIAADTCLQMLAPDSPSDLAPHGSVVIRPTVADRRAHSVLEAPSSPLDRIAGELWDLRRAADLATQRWRSAKLSREHRRQADKAILSWISHLAAIYWRTFGVKPHMLKATSPFARFANGARQIASRATVTGTDDDARKGLKNLTPARLADWARRNRAELAERANSGFQDSN
jgi:hypothetical protein